MSYWKSSRVGISSSATGLIHELKTPARHIEYYRVFFAGGAVVGFISIVKCAAVLSLVIILEMTWVICARRKGAISGDTVSLAISIVIVTVVAYAFLVFIIAARVMAPLFYQL